MRSSLVDHDELASIPAGAMRDDDLVGRFRMTRMPGQVLLLVLPLLLAPAVWGLGAPAPAAGLAAAAVTLWLVVGARRVSTFEIDDAGRLHLRRHGALDWAEVDEVSYRLRYPVGTPARRRDGAVPTATVRIHRRGRPTIRLARGQLFRTRPTRAHVSLHRLSDFLRRACRTAGMDVERTDEARSGWRAVRR